jgi:hypothetical protein
LGCGCCLYELPRGFLSTFFRGSHLERLDLLFQLLFFGLDLSYRFKTAVLLLTDLPLHLQAQALGFLLSVLRHLLCVRTDAGPCNLILGRL